jgi:hypothetical protein
MHTQDDHLVQVIVDNPFLHRLSVWLSQSKRDVVYPPVVCFWFQTALSTAALLNYLERGGGVNRKRRAPEISGWHNNPISAWL